MDGVEEDVGGREGWRSQADPGAVFMVASHFSAYQIILIFHVTYFLAPVKYRRALLRTLLISDRFSELQPA